MLPLIAWIVSPTKFTSSNLHKGVFIGIKYLTVFGEKNVCVGGVGKW